MRHNKWFGSFALIAGLAVSGGSTLVAADRDWDDHGRVRDDRSFDKRGFDNRAWNDRGARYDQRDVRGDYRDVRNDYTAIDRLRADVARDQYQLDEDIRCGRVGAVARDQFDLNRDQQALAALMHDVHEDREDIRRDQRNVGYGGGFGNGYRR